VKVFVTLSIDVDAAAWDAAYGTGTAAGAVRDDVRRYVLTQVQESAAAREDRALKFARLGMASGAGILPRS
jgi:hypothetical protein